MKISHREFEECAQNPAEWLRARKISPSGSFIPMGYNGYTKLAILKYHKTNSEEEARRALSSYLARFRNIDRISECEDIFDLYIAWYRRTNPIVIETRRRIEININYGNFIGGEVTRVDLTPDGYLGVLLGNISGEWRRELRMPLIQLGLSQIYGRKIADFSVGIQNLDGSGFEIVSFPESRVNAALRQARALSRKYLAQL